jgi:hypothetical protein
MTMTAEWKQVPFETPRALELKEISGIIRRKMLSSSFASSLSFSISSIVLSFIAQLYSISASNAHLIELIDSLILNQKTGKWGQSPYLQVVVCVAG